jgi:hypothetical protein
MQQVKVTAYVEKRDELIRGLAGLFSMPQGRSLHSWFLRRAIYRGKGRFIVGYSWKRTYSHHLSGRVYDAVLGYGDDFDAALADAVRRESRKLAKRIG